MSRLLEAVDLARWYGPVAGLCDLTLSVEGGVIGLLGPNGAGKSTFLKLVAGEIRPSRGRVSVLGERPFANRQLFERVGFCPQQDAVYGDMTGLEFVAFLMRLHGFSRAQAIARAGTALERVGLAEAVGRRTGTYSKGMRQRVKLAQAIAHEPEFLIADEPLTGLDPAGRREVLELLRGLGRRGVHVLASSHVLHEVESLTDEVVLLHRGRILAQGRVAEIRALLSRHPRKVEVRARDARALARALVSRPEVASLRIAADGEGLSLETLDVDALLEALPAIVASAGAGLRSIESPDAGLEAVFDYLVN